MAQYQIDNIPSPIDFQEDDIVKRALQNYKNLLMCNMWEVPYDRCRGFDPALFDLPIDQFRYELPVELDRIAKYEPDIEVVDSEATLLDNGDIYIKVIVECLIRESGRGTM